METRIGKKAAGWIRRLVFRQTKDADNPLYGPCQKFLQKLYGAPQQELSHSVLLKRMKTDARNFRTIVSTLEQRGDIEVITIPRPGQAKRSYRLTKGGIEHAERIA